jgi:hypothetical protein
LPDELYEIIALAARYWFLLLMVLIAWRSYRWYARDRKKNKRRLRLLPDAGYIGELVVVQGDELVKKGTCLPVSREGVLGYLRSNDVCVPMGGIANRHLWYLFDETDGLQVEPFRGRRIVADGRELTGRQMRAFLGHGSTLQVGEAEMRLRMFSGFEYAGETDARSKPLDEAGEPDIAGELEDKAHSDPVRRMHEIADWQTMMEEETEDGGQEFYPPETDDEDEDAVPPEDEAESGPEAPVFYPPVIDGDEDGAPPADENGEAPKSLYVDEDEAEYAKRVFWDKYFRGGNRR